MERKKTDSKQLKDRVNEVAGSTFSIILKIAYVLSYLTILLFLILGAVCSIILVIKLYPDIAKGFLFQFVIIGILIRILLFILQLSIVLAVIYLVVRLFVAVLENRERINKLNELRKKKFIEELKMEIKKDKKNVSNR